MTTTVTTPTPREFVDVLDLIVQYRSGTSVADLAKTTGWDRSTIYKTLKESGVPLRNDRRGGRPISDDVRAEVYALRAAGMTMRAVSAVTGVSPSGISKIERETA